LILHLAARLPLNPCWKLLSLNQLLRKPSLNTQLPHPPCASQSPFQAQPTISTCPPSCAGECVHEPAAIRRTNGVTMEKKLIDSICRQVYQRFPEVKGSKPSVRTQTTSQSVLIFKGKGTTADGNTIQRTVRVVVSDQGKILKMTTSR
jgi:hypothetical protein